MHWYVRVLTCSFVFEQLTESEFLTKLSDACIGKFVSTDDNFKIELDVSRFKKVWIEKHKERKKIEEENPLRVAFHDLCISALQQTTIPEFSKMMDKPGQFHSFNIPPVSKLDYDFRKYIQLFLDGADLAERSEANRSQEIQSRQQTFKQANWNLPLRITLYGGGRVDLLIPTDKPKTYIAHSG